MEEEARWGCSRGTPGVPSAGHTNPTWSFRSGGGEWGQSHHTPTPVDQMSLHYGRQKPNMQLQVRATFWNRRHLE